MTDAAPDTTLDAEVRATNTVGRPADELRELWLRPDTQSRIWAHFADVTATSDGEAEWRAHGPGDRDYRWRTRTQETGGDTIRWSSLDGADIANAGLLTFTPAPGDRGTELHLDVRFDPPGGAVGEALAKLFHLAPKEILAKALYNFRALALTGEIPTTDPQPAARKGGVDR